ncbi:MAG: glycosyltransferase [Acidimicrobiales bacterium]
MADGSVYLGWRFIWSFGSGNTIIGAVLLITEVFSWFSLFTLVIYSWNAQPSQHIEPNIACPIAVLICTYDESSEVLRATILGALALVGPKTVYVLDDGRRPEIAALTRQLGVSYSTRSDNAHAKAGNINAALAWVKEEFLFILDADHVPMPYALSELSGYFRCSPNLALVQSPHDFYNQDSLQHFRPGCHEQSVFYQVIMPGKDHHGAAYWAGSAALIRTAALVDIGGVATETIAEDFHTTIRLLTAGWTTRYHDRILVQGVAPIDIDGYLLQRDRWARGNLAVLRTRENPITCPGLTLAQRASFVASLFAYLAGPMRLVTLGVLGAMLITGQLPYRLNWSTLLVLWVPWAVASRVAGAAFSRGYVRIGESVHYEQLTGGIYLRSLPSAVFATDSRFRVTPKRGVDSGGLAALVRLPEFLFTTGLVVLGVALQVINLIWTVIDHGSPLRAIGLPPLALFVLLALAVIELHRAASTIVSVTRRRQRREEFRFPTSLKCQLRIGDQIYTGHLVNCNTTGAAIALNKGQQPAFIECSDVVTLEISGLTQALGVVPRWQTQKGATPIVGLQFLAPTEAEINALTLYCYVTISAARLQEGEVSITEIPQLKRLPKTSDPHYRTG